MAVMRLLLYGFELIYQYGTEIRDLNTQAAAVHSKSFLDMNSTPSSLLPKP